MSKPYKTYSEKLQDPRWQKKRLEILTRDNWKCQECGETEVTLHVHHRRYIRGREPWEYDNKHLVTLCKGCHEDESRFFAASLARVTDELQDNCTWFFVENLATALKDHGRDAIWVAHFTGELLRLQNRIVELSGGRLTKADALRAIRLATDEELMPCIERRVKFHTGEDEESSS